MSLHAFEALEIPDKLPLKVECIDVYHHNGKVKLLVGTAEGQLLIYDASGKELNNMKQLALSKKPIMQICVVEIFNLLLVLSDGIIAVHTLPGIVPNQPICVIKKSQGAMMFAVDRLKGVIRLAIALKSKKLLLMHWDPGVSEFVEKKEFNMLEQAKSVTWIGDNVSVGNSKEYVTFDVSLGTVEDRPLEKGTTACAYQMPDGNLLEVHYRTTASILDPLTGKSARQFGINFIEPPMALAFSAPYILALTSKGVEVRPYFESTVLHQFIPLSNPRFIASDSGHGSIDRRGQGIAYVAGRKDFWILQPIPLERQVESLKQDGAYEEALVLCESVTDEDLDRRTQLMADCKIRIAFKSYLDGLYHQAFKFFADLAIDPLTLLGLFGAGQWVWNPKEFTPLLPPNVQRIVASKLPETIPRYSETNFRKALTSLLTYLNSFRSQNPQLGSAPLTDDVRWEDVNDLATLLDTSILLIAVQLNDATTVTSIITKKDSHCHYRRSEDALRSVNRHDWLVAMFCAKKHHETALIYLKGLSIDKDAGAFYGPNKTMDYLVHLGPEWWESVIRKYSEWVVLANPIDSYKVFTHGRTQETLLPPLEVLIHLKTVTNRFEGLTGKTQARHLIIKYLEHMIFKMGCSISDLHNELVFCYFKEVFALKEAAYKAAGISAPPISTYVVAGSEPGELGIARSTLINFLKNSQYYSAPQIHAARFPLDENAMFEEKALLHSKDGQHSAALKIIINQMKEPWRAEEYCAKFYGSKEGNDVYLDLFRILIEPQSDPDDQMLNLNAAISLLTRHSSKIEFSLALELLPPITPLSRLETFFQSVIREKNQQLRENQVVLNICKTESMRVTSELYKLRNQSVKILPETTCHECKKKIGEAVFAVYEGKVVHYRCFPQFHQHSGLDSSGLLSGADNLSSSLNGSFNAGPSSFGGRATAMSSDNSPGLASSPYGMPSTSSSRPGGGPGGFMTVGQKTANSTSIDFGNGSYNQPSSNPSTNHPSGNIPYSNLASKPSSNQNYGGNPFGNEIRW